VAQRTGAERFLASAAKTTSAGAVALALVAVAFLLIPGCGGGSSEGQTAITSSSSSPAAQAEDQAGAGESAAASEGAGSPQGVAAAGVPASGSSPASDAASPSTAGGQKHGPHIAPPKGPQEQAASPAQIENATVADMSLTSPAIVASDGHLGRLADTYTCDGENTWPALKWGGVPADSKELVLFVMNVQPVAEKIFFDWALAGIDPGLSEISAGELPKGVISGTNGFGKRGYEICPSGPGETYMLALYALPRSLSSKPGFDPLSFRQEVLDASGDVGLLPGVYERG
jgi:phosphatidylethanolamine-binding protein (PEBP) family uncharacterized protein